MSTEDLVGVLILGSFAVMMAWEALAPARAFPKRAWWRLKGWGWLLLMAAQATALPLLLPQQWLVEHRLLDLSGLGTVGGVVVGYTVVSFVNYWYHRACHRFDFMWRTFHQMHHAPQRLDMGGAAVFHPLDLWSYVLLSTLVSTLVLGLSPEAAALTSFVAQFYSFFQHMNVKTPQWLGFLIQRPEAHFVHHQRDVHAYNYGDLPIWDVLLGTFRNPAQWGAQDVGFESPMAQNYAGMLALKDVSSSVGTRVQSDVAPSLVQTAG